MGIDFFSDFEKGKPIFKKLGILRFSSKRFFQSLIITNLHPVSFSALALISAGKTEKLESSV